MVRQTSDGRYILSCCDCGQTFQHETLIPSRCSDCHASRVISDEKIVQRMALLLGAMMICGRPTRASELRTWLGSEILGDRIYPWMLQELAEYGFVTVEPDPSGRRGFQRYSLVQGLNTSQLWAHIERGVARRKAGSRALAAVAGGEE